MRLPDMNCNSSFLKRVLSRSSSMRAAGAVRVRPSRHYSGPTTTPARGKRIAQPMAYSHPHLLRPGELTPGVTITEYAQRRQALMKQLPENSFAVSKVHTLVHTLRSLVSGHPERFMSNDIPTDFWYLSGFLEPDSHMIVSNVGAAPGADTLTQYSLLVRPRDPAREIWDGPRAGLEGAMEHFGVTHASTNTELEGTLQSLAKQAKWMFHDSLAENTVASIKKANPSLQIGDAEKIIERMRVVKSPAEVNLMRRACKESGDAFAAAMTSTKAGLTQHQLEAIIEFHCRVRGARQLGYPPVVASGIDNNTLHYISNDEILCDGDLVLMDAGGEFDGYNADITRCWPVNGRFTPAQRKVYQAVLDVQKACIEVCRPGITLNKLYGFSVRLVLEELKKLGILDANASTDAFRRFYPHSVGHYLGMDIHDCQSMSNGELLSPGMVVTVEPGIYIPDEPSIPAELRGIGVRIEDDVLITPEGCEVLTYTAPKEISDIEEIMRNVDKGQ